MPLITAAIGLASEPFEHAVDARWTMAYSAGLGDVEPCYLDTTRAGGVVAHPLFAICPEWPVALASRDQLRQRGLSMDEFRRAVHATHDCHVERLVRPGDVLTTRATILAIESWRAGAFVTTVFDSHDQHGALVARTFHGQLLREVEVMSVDKAPSAPPDPDVTAPPPARAADDTVNVVHEELIPVAANFAHVYTECARIWNPVHTDEAVARAAGLPHFILHGSASLALAVSAVLRLHAPGEPQRVRRIGGQFRAMVLLPSTLRLAVGAARETAAGRVVPFDLYTADGGAAVRYGSVVFDAG